MRLARMVSVHRRDELAEAGRVVTGELDRPSLELVGEVARDGRLAGRDPERSTDAAVGDVDLVVRLYRVGEQCEEGVDGAATRVRVAG